MDKYTKFSAYGIAAAATKQAGEGSLSIQLAKKAIEFGSITDSRHFYRHYIDNKSSFTDFSLQPTHTENTGQSQEQREEYASVKGNVHFFPKKLGEGLTRQNVRIFIDEHFQDYIPPKPITSGTKIITMGSCFAQNIGSKLESLGAVVDSFGLTENVNNPKTLNHLIRASLQSDSQEQKHKTNEYTEDAYLDRLVGKTKLRKLSEAMHNCDIIIITLGVSCYLECSSSNKTFFVKPHKCTTNLEYPQGEYRLKRMSVADVKFELKMLMDSIVAINSSASVIFTVSPIPASGFDNIEVKSMISADLMSKSTLFCACQEYIAENPNQLLYYWPSFEIVRGLSPWLDFRSFGTEDQSARHPSDVLVDAALELFIKTRKSRNN